MDKQKRAERAAAAMMQGDKAIQNLGLTLENVAPGAACLNMIVRPDMVNAHGICHGGLIYLLADTAFAFAANSYNISALAHHNAITYLSPGEIDETLTATAHQVTQVGRSGIFDVAVTGADGREVAQFRGHSRQVRGHLFDE